MTNIDYFLSTISPYVYLSGMRPAEIAARHGLALTYRPLDVMALFPRTGGKPLADRHESRKAYRLQELRRQSVKTGLALNVQPLYWPANAAPSSYAIIAAQAAVRDGADGDLGGLVHGFTRACWAENRNIAEDDVVRDILATHGFDPGLADRGMLAGAEAYVRNIEDAVTMGVFGVPFFIVEGEKFWGQDRLDDLDRHLSGGL